MSSAPRIRYGVIGAGNLAQVAVLPAFAHARENSELVAIVSSDEAKREALRERYGLGHVGSYDDMEKVLAEARADAVYITVPNQQHREFTTRAFAAGLHVLCEKPMAMTVSDCEAMNAAAAAVGKKLMIAYRLHFEECTLRALEIASSGQLGEPRYFSSVFSHQIKPNDIRTRADLGGGALFDLGPYPINAARKLFRSEPTEVFAYAARGIDPRSSEVDEMTTAVLRFPDDRLAQFTVSQGAASVSNYRIVGTEGDLRVEPGFEYAGALKQFLTVKEKTTETTFPRRDQFAPELIHFSSCILNDTEPGPSGLEGLADLRVLEALSQSIAKGGPVTIEHHPSPPVPDMDQELRKPPVRKVDPVHAPSPTR